MSEATVTTPADGQEITPQEITPENETETTPEVQEIAPDLTTTDGIALLVADAGGATVAEEALPAVLEMRNEFASLGRKAAQTVTRLTGYFKRMAEYSANVRRYFLLADGPDWGGTSQAYKRTFESALAEAFPVESFSVSDRNKATNAIKQHRNRTFLEIAIRQYVRETVDGMPSEKEADTPAFLHEVKKEYQRCDLTPPSRYLSPEEKGSNGGSGGGGGPQGESQTPAEAAVAALAGLAEYSPKYQALGTLRAVSDLAARVHGASEIPDRPEVVEIVNRARTVLSYVVKDLASAATPDDWDALGPILFNSDDTR